MRDTQNTLVNRGIDSLKIFGMAGSILLASACDSESEPNPTPTTTSAECFQDRDCDGILDNIDKDAFTPELSNDADSDGLGNRIDQYPYDPNNGITIQPVPPGTTPQPRPTYSNTDPVRCQSGLKPDSDGDNIPDWCDTSFDLYSHDTDSDGLADAFDAYPYTADHDNDGIPDGQDVEPGYNQKRQEQQRQEEANQEQRQEERRQEEANQQRRQEEQRQEERRQEQRRQEQQDNGY